MTEITLFQSHIYGLYYVVDCLKGGSRAFPPPPPHGEKEDKTGTRKNGRAIFEFARSFSNTDFARLRGSAHSQVQVQVYFQKLQLHVNCTLNTTRLQQCQLRRAVNGANGTKLSRNDIKIT